jgi:hypothetical protein
VKRWVNVKILVGLSMLSTLVLGLTAIAREPRPEPNRWTHEGRTEQGLPIVLRTGKDGKLRTFYTRIGGVCRGRTPHTIIWRPSANGAPAVFDGRGPHFEAEEVSERTAPDGTWSAATLRIEGHIDQLGASGTVRYFARYRYPSGSVNRCESPIVHWTAHR